MKAAAGILFIANGKVLLLKRENGHWGLPGGHIEPGESAADAAVRETLEECQYRVKAPIKEYAKAISPEVTFTTFLCRIPGEFRPVLNHEHTAYLWTSGIPDSTHPMLTKILRGLFMDIEKPYTSEFLKRFDVAKMKRLGYMVVSEAKNPEGTYTVIYRKRTSDAVEGIVYKTLAEAKAAAEKSGGRPEQKFDTSKESPYNTYWVVKPAAKDSSPVDLARAKLAQHRQLMQALTKNGVVMPADMLRKEKFLQEEVQKAEARSSDAKDAPSISSLEKQIESLTGSLGMAREKRKMRGQHEQSQREVELASKISKLRQELHLLRLATKDAESFQETERKLSEALKKVESVWSRGKARLKELEKSRPKFKNIPTASGGYTIAPFTPEQKAKMDQVKQEGAAIEKEMWSVWQGIVPLEEKYYQAQKAQGKPRAYPPGFSRSNFGGHTFTYYRPPGH